MQDKPCAEYLVAEVCKALGEGLSPGFAQKVAVNALGIAQRELAISQASSAAECVRLEKLFGLDGDLVERNSRLAKDIRSGRKADEALVEHLILTTLAKIEVDQPSYPPLKEWKKGI